MRTALLTLTLIEALTLAHPAEATFRCFDTPDSGWRCSCVGSDECEALLKSGNCKSALSCDKGELGSMICSCKAPRASMAKP
jgi:hypothetical protein